jgi:two-component system response regulator QseB
MPPVTIMRILVVEDDKKVASFLEKGLREEGYVVDVAHDGDDGLLKARVHEYDLLLLDVMLPGTSGLEIVRDIRSREATTPVLVLTARAAEEDVVLGLDAGADDYLVKPFDLEELAARVRALLRRKSGRADPVIQAGGLIIDPATHEVSMNGTPVALSAREFALLHALAARPGVVYSRAQLEEKLYGWGREVESNTVEVYVHSLRRKLGANLIHNVRGVGYMVPKQT